jgi:integrative and conjugative element protein (TIGR02256 family)
MSPGQKLALEQLHGLAAYDNHCFEVVGVTEPDAESASLRVRVGINCDGIPSVPEGIRFRSREFFILKIDPEFPYIEPSAITPHRRFAGRAHVYFGNYICVYQAPKTEWNADDGMFGFVQRLRHWIEQAAVNQLDATDAPAHPPYTHVGEEPLRIVVSKTDAPVSGDNGWWGLALLDTVKPSRVDIVGWSQDLSIAHRPCAAAILFPRPLPWDMPRNVGDVLTEIERAGLERDLLLAVLKFAVVTTNKGDPLYVVIGAPMRGTVGGGAMRQHLMVWHVNAVIADCLRFAIPNASDCEEAAAIRKTGDQIVLDWAKTAEMHWCAVLEDRPEIVTRRDYESPTSIFRDKIVALWGCGALGSYVAMFLARAGVQKLILRDSGIVKPGILVRQDYDEADVGSCKASALAQRLKRIRPSLEVVVEIVDLVAALRPDFPWTSGADVVIDCTASPHVHAKLEMVRRASELPSAAMISMVVDGHATRGLVVVARAEHSGGIADVYRKAKLEACRKPWLRHFADCFHPAGPEVELFQPEPGCSDATFVGSAADSAVLAGMMLNLACKHLARDDDETAFADYVSQPHAITGNDQQAFGQAVWGPDLSWNDSDDDYEIRITNGAWREIQAWIARSARLRGVDVETGGLLFGKRDDAARIIWVDEASGPPPDSVAEVDSFICGVEGTREMNEQFKESSRQAVQYVGMWHTHPFALPTPSPTDLSGLEQVFSAGMMAPSKHLMLIVGTANDLRVLASHVFRREDFIQSHAA